MRLLTLSSSQTNLLKQKLKFNPLPYNWSLSFLHHWPLWFKTLRTKTVPQFLHTKMNHNSFKQSKSQYQMIQKISISNNPTLSFELHCYANEQQDFLGPSTISHKTDDGFAGCWGIYALYDQPPSSSPSPDTINQCWHHLWVPQLGHLD